MVKTLPQKYKSNRKCNRERCFTLTHKIFLGLHLLNNKTGGEGVAEKDLVKFVCSNFEIDGDVEDQIRTALNYLLTPGYVIRCRNRYRTIAPAACIQLTKFNTLPRQNAVEHVTRTYSTFPESNKIATPQRETRSGSRKPDEMTLPEVDATCLPSAQENNCQQSQESNPENQTEKSTSIRDEDQESCANSCTSKRKTMPRSRKSRGTSSTRVSVASATKCDLDKVKKRGRKKTIIITKEN